MVEPQRSMEGVCGTPCRGTNSCSSAHGGQESSTRQMFSYPAQCTHSLRPDPEQLCTNAPLTTSHTLITAPLQHRAPALLPARHSLSTNKQLHKFHHSIFQQSHLSSRKSLCAKIPHYTDLSTSPLSTPVAALGSLRRETHIHTPHLALWLWCSGGTCFCCVPCRDQFLIQSCRQCQQHRSPS